MRIARFREGMKRLGYVEGRDVRIEYRASQGQGERLDALALELVALRPEVIVTSGTPGALAMKKATSSIPVVVSAVNDFVSMGLVTNLARPDGNITGMTSLSADLSGKRVELLAELMPGIKRAAVLFYAGNPAAVRALQETQVAAQRMGLQLQVLEVRTASDLAPAFDAAVKTKAPAIIVIQDTFTMGERTRIVELASRHRLPAIYGSNLVVEAGGLMSYSPDYNEIYRHTAVFVDRILKGAKPADLPVEQPSKFELVINLKTAKALGISISQPLLVRADKVIQ
jgi:putative tryptophan/tyrosine transport system substrate-binding protein